MSDRRPESGGSVSTGQVLLGLLAAVALVGASTIYATQDRWADPEPADGEGDGSGPAAPEPTPPFPGPEPPPVVEPVPEPPDEQAPEDPDPTTPDEGAPQEPTAPWNRSRIAFGMDAGSIEAQRAGGFDPDLGTLWLGPWTLEHGWRGVDAKLREMASQNVTPAVHLYYWGDDLSPRCLEAGCWSTLHDVRKDREGWQELVERTVEHLEATMDGKEVLVLLESEFNKASVATYEPLDAYLAEKAAFIQEAYPPARVTLSLGNWNHAAWPTWDRAADQVDAMGLQAIRASTRDTLSSQHGLFNATLKGVEVLEHWFGGPIVLQDISVSSYPDPEHRKVQSRALERLFEGMDRLEARGVDTVIYRSWFDNPSMSDENYFGEAERFWGLVTYPGKEPKPAAEVWLDGVGEARS